ncbi:unnamed protein product [Trypanosoma congolense IL3000]|uniref:WGS project CAEQ00000000 data, annotated contig 384 n=1 Tax=Trypanosoma congolense (strain IL3000) TaxID=1068625 RepID=F9WFG5_TRYCI|nr:unnamed protein product [Trypanosoma congolense IL3000]
MKTTWTNVTVPCLNSDGGAEYLKALEKFKQNLDPLVEGDPTHQILGESNFTNRGGCGGTLDDGVCVTYSTKREEKTWWSELDEAVKKDEEKRAQENGRREDKKQAAQLISAPQNVTLDRKNTTLNIILRASSTYLTPLFLSPLGAVTLTI